VVRLFVALEIPSAVRDKFTVLTNGLRSLDRKPGAKKPRWVRAENLHLTLKFIGTIAPERLEGIRGVLAGVRSELPVQLRFRGIGFFPDAKRPRVIWAGVAESENLTAIAANVDRALAELEVPSEQRAFTPHLTLARCEPTTISSELKAAIDKNAASDFGELRTNEFHLIESRLKPTGAEYTTLQSFPFSAEA
jgi:2'-5' RNA ligase